MCLEDLAHISSGATFFPRSGEEKARHLRPSLISEHYKQWSYLSIIDTKAARGKAMGAFSAGNVSLPRGTCKKKTATKRRMGVQPRQTEATFLPASECTVSLTKPQINSLCHVPPGSQTVFSSSQLLNRPLLRTGLHNCRGRKQIIRKRF